MSAAPASEILVVGARALARGGGLQSTLQLLVDTVAEHLDGVGSIAVFVRDERTGRLEIAASHGLDDVGVVRLEDAVANPAHPVARTVTESVPSFDVLPTAPGGPRLRSHLPLVVTRDGADTVLGVLALAHDQEVVARSRLLEAVADLAAVAVERQRPG